MNKRHKPRRLRDPYDLHAAQHFANSIFYNAQAVLLLVSWNRHLILTFSGDAEEADQDRGYRGGRRALPLEDIF